MKTSIFEPLCFLKWCPIFDSPESKIRRNIFILLIFLLKSTPCWLASAKFHHWGYTITFSYRPRKLDKSRKCWPVKRSNWALFDKHKNHGCSDFLIALLNIVYLKTIIESSIIYRIVCMVTFLVSYEVLVNVS